MTVEKFDIDRKNNYTKNMEVLEKLHPKFAKFIRETPDVNWILDVPRTKDGPANLRIRDSRHRELKIYNEPIGNKDLDEQVVLHDQKGTLLFGLGAAIVSLKRS